MYLINIEIIKFYTKIFYKINKKKKNIFYKIRCNIIKFGIIGYEIKLYYTI